MAIELIKQEWNVDSKTIYCINNKETNYGTYKIGTSVICFMLEGQITLIFKRKKVTYHSGEIFSMIEGLEVAYEKAADQETGQFSCIFVYMSMNFYIEVSKRFTINQNEYTPSANFSSIFSQSERMQSLLRTMSNDLLQIHDSEWNNSNTFMLMQLIYIEDKRLFSQFAFLCRYGEVNYEELIQNHPDLTILELSRFCGCSYQTINRKHHLVSSFSLRQFRLSSLNSKAIDLVRNTDNRIYMIAEVLGYSGPGNFTRSYKKINGITPLQDRKKYSKRK